MNNVYACTRVTIDSKSTEEQLKIIAEYLKKNNLVMTAHIDENEQETYINKYDQLDDLNDGDILIVVSLDRLRKTITQTFKLLNMLGNKGVIIHLIDVGMIIDKNIEQKTTILPMHVLEAFTTLDHNLLSQRSKLSLEKMKKEKTATGRPKGSTSKSIYDDYVKEIAELIEKGVSLSKIWEFYINVGSRQGLAKFVRSDRYKELCKDL